MFGGCRARSFIKGTARERLAGFADEQHARNGELGLVAPCDVCVGV
jgi:hypothetical protein